MSAGTRYGLADLADIEALARQKGVAPQANGVDAGPIEDVRQIPSIFSYAAQKIDFVVQGRIAAGTISMVSGEPGCGKTTLMTDLCSAVERGDPFAGLATQRRPVLILDRENPLPVVVERFRRLGIRDSQDFTVWGGWTKHGDAPMPGSPIVQRFVEQCEPKPLILIDSLIAFMEGDENDAGEMRKFMQALRRLADMGATIIVLHHSGKAESAKDYRGSSDIKAAIDVGYTLANFGDSGRLSSLRLKTFKARFTVETDTVFRYVNDRFHVDSQPPSKTNEEILREIVINNPGSSRAELEDLAGDKVKRSRVRELLDQWVSSGQIRVENSRRRQSHFWAS